MKRHELRSDFLAGKLPRDDYGAALRETHRDLEEYASFLQSTDVGALIVADGGVTLRSRIGGALFHCDFDDLRTPPMVTLAFGRYEPLEMQTLLRLLDGASTFVDAGANVGWYAVHAATVYPGLRVVALEPALKTHEALDANIALNRLSIAAPRIGLSDQPGELDLHVAPTRTDAASLRPSRDYDGQATEKVTLTTLDSLRRDLDLHVDVIKADVEGAELPLLRGATTTLAQDRPAVLAEMLRLHSAAFGYHPNEILELMSGLGYACWASFQDRWRPFTVMDDETVETNFLFLHRNRHASELAALDAGTFLSVGD